MIAKQIHAFLFLARYFLKKATTLFLYFLAPPQCTGCALFLTMRELLCSSCRARIMPIVSKDLIITQKYTMKVLAIGDYQEPLKNLILAKKYGNIAAATALGELIWYMTYVAAIECDYIIPVPLHWTRFAKRGYNQADEMADVLSRHMKRPKINLLRRIKMTAFQSALKHEERLPNVQDAFVLTCKDKEKYQGKHLILVDDLMTTGATLHAAARQLRDLNPASITAVVACRVV